MLTKTLVALLAVLGLVMSASAVPSAPAPVSVSGLSLEGEVEGENLFFTLKFNVDSAQRQAVLPLVTGEVAYIESQLPRGAELVRDGGGFSIRFVRPRSGLVSFRFAARPMREGDWRSASFCIPSASIRRLAVVCDRADLEIRFPGALDVQTQKTADGKLKATAFLGLGSDFQVDWKPEVRRLEAELVASCDANLIAIASVGALRVDGLYTVRVIQGTLSRLMFDLPDGNITQVTGEDIQDWRVDRTDAARPRLAVVLSRPQEGTYRLRVESEMALPRFPCRFTLPALKPVQMLRTGGFMVVGTDSAIRLNIEKAGGLTQVDAAAVPRTSLDPKGQKMRSLPLRQTYAYQFANMPFTLDIGADDIVTSVAADSRLVLLLEESDLSLEASVELTIKDAPAREVVIETAVDPVWTVTTISGPEVAEADTDVRDDGGVRRIVIPFKHAVMGTVLVNVRMECLLPVGTARFSAPAWSVAGARSERGHLVAAAEKGVRLKVETSDGLREIHTGSAPMRVKDAQQAFRFRDKAWKLEMGLDRTMPSLHSEVFHLASLGDGVLYYSATLTYHIGGSPAQEFRIRMPAGVENPEFTGADIEGWTRQGDVCTVRLQKRVLGDYTLLVTYDRQFDYEKADIQVGGIETVGTDSEVGYVALASSASLRLSETAALPPAVIGIDRDEIPKGYSGPVSDPILKAYKFVRSPHAFGLRVERLQTERLLGQIADYVHLDTIISRDGEAVTTATYLIKNASHQFLVVSLPAGAKLWSIRQGDEQDGARDVLSQTSGKKLLIPVARQRDPNAPIRIELRFAQSYRKLGLLTSGVRGLALAAPLMEDAPSPFMNWTVRVPRFFALADARGNMEIREVSGARGLADAVRTAFRLCLAILDGPGGREVSPLFMGEWSGGLVREYSRTASTAESGAPALTVLIVPSWLGAGCRVGLLGSLMLAGLALCAGGLMMRRRVLLAAGLTAFLCGLVMSLVGRYVVAVGLALLLATLAGVWLFRLARLAVAGLCSRRRSAPPPVPPVLDCESADVQRSAADEEPVDRPSAGSARLGLMVMLAALSATLPWLAGAGEPVGSELVMDRVLMEITGPLSARDTEKSARVVVRYQFEAKDAVRLIAIPDGYVLTNFRLGSDDLRLAPGAGGYQLDVLRRGRYEVMLEYRAPVRETNGCRRVVPYLPDSLRNSVRLAIPEPGMNIESESAVVFRLHETDQSSEAEAVFGRGGCVSFDWKPRVRTTRREAAVYFAEIHSLAALLPGAVDVMHAVRLQIAQGEVKEFRMSVPKGMSVTSVKAPGVATWSFEPEKRQLDVVLERAVSGAYAIMVGTQLATEGLPYAAELGTLDVVGAARQRGAMALAASDSVQVRAEDARGVSAINPEDFPGASAILVEMDAQRSSGLVVRKAFRFQETAAVSVPVSADRVLPEIRINEFGTLSIADERVVMASRMEVAVSKAGVFSLLMEMPPDYEVETLTGRDVSHWDVVRDGEKGIRVHFVRQIMDGTELNIVLVRTEKGVEKQVAVPRIGVRDARKHTGRFTVSGERGIRMMVESHSGVDVKKASEEGIHQAGVLVFDILRPGWAITLRTEVQAPVVKPDILQWVDLTEGMLQGRVFIRYRIENAGVRSFWLRAPNPETTLTVSGRNIARVHETDRTNGIWQVDLHAKVEQGYALTVSYTTPYAPESQKARIEPLRVLQTDSPRGFLAVTCSGRVQVEASGDLTGLIGEDPRGLPPEFGAGDLSHAILCYRTVRPDYALDLSVVRHGSAEVLPARIRWVRISSVVSVEDRLLNHVTVEMDVGNLRFLNVELPHADDRLWTVTVNGRQVAASRDRGRYCIPLEAQAGTQPTAVEFVYAGSVGVGRLGARRELQAPSFELPLNGIRWELYVSPSIRYYGFDGSMEYIGSDDEMCWFDAQQYLAWNQRRREDSLTKARDILSAGEQLVKAGRQGQARKAFQQAYNYSQAQADLNEDARVQLRNLLKQQVKVGLVNRRSAVRSARNIVDDQPSPFVPEAADGSYDPETARRVERTLSEHDNEALDVLADKLIDQQEAAADTINAINVTTPKHGRRLTFRRELQIDPSGKLTIVFKTSPWQWLRSLNVLWPPALLFTILAVTLRRRRPGA